MSHRHLLSPKLFYFCLLYSHTWLFQTSHNGPLISLWVPSSVSTLSQARIYNDLATVLTKWFSIMAQGSLQIYLLQNSFLFGRQYLLSRVSSWSSIVMSHSQEGLKITKWGGATAISYWLFLSRFSCRSITVLLSFLPKALESLPSL